ncbi:DUF6653 family protein [Sulfitobacter sp. SK011]|uniref:DUF6653 family protein n=1 Tax=Sulfitobacter sp. SK011 TaxID=1389004 RepID=UPI000E0B8124|nr:DUF6653 family protein [Sulfitobacter sp. SK011]AXI42840.1 hypothetical protein C1J02_13505 [Sulfitobacter sp. SK011]
MKLAAWAERLMGMNDVVWARHANPWSGWTRMATGLPLFSLAVWSRVWLGWGAVLAVAVAIAWIWFNPRAFAPPDNIDNWMSKGVYGERIYLEHKAELPAHHQRAALVLGWLTLPGIVIMTWGLWGLWWEGAVFGTALAMLPKIWFVDRMVWIFEDWQRAGRAVPGLPPELTQGADNV